MKRILLSLATIALVGGVGVAATRAFFSDVETSTGNKFEAGKLDLQIASTAHYDGLICTEVSEGVYQWELPAQGGQTSREDLIHETCNGSWGSKDLDQERFFELTDIKPGDEGENTITLNVDDNPSWACVDIKNMQNLENVCTESETGDTTCGAGIDQGELAQNINFFAWLDLDGDNIWNGAETKLFTNTFGPASDVFNDKTYVLAEGGGTPIPGATPLHIGLRWCAGTMTVDEETKTVSCDGVGMGNNTQTDSVIADIAFRVEQARNNPNFTCAQ